MHNIKLNYPHTHTHTLQEWTDSTESVQNVDPTHNICEDGNEHLVPIDAERVEAILDEGFSRVGSVYMYVYMYVYVYVCSLV